MVLEGQVGIPCDCGHVTAKTIAWLQSHHQFTCSRCRARVRLDTSQFRRDIGEVERRLSRFPREIKVRLE